MSVEQKLTLYNHCRQFLQTKIHETEIEIASLQASANEETKSSAGDKYETGRAMAQLEIEKLTGLLSDFKKQLQTLDHIHVDKEYESVQQGSLVTTNNGYFFVSVSAGELQIDGKKIFCLSINSPLGSRLKGLKQGDSFALNNRQFVIQSVV